MKFLLTFLLVLLLCACSSNTISKINITTTINPEHQPQTYNLLVKVVDDDGIENVTINIPEMMQSRSFSEINFTEWQYEETLDVEGVVEEDITIEIVVMDTEGTISTRSSNLIIK